METITALGRAHLPAAQRLLTTALPHDRVDLIADEKLFGANGARDGVALGAFRDGELVGVAAFAGRWIKVLAVDAAHRRRGIGSALLARLVAPRRRAIDHPGNYLTPGLDVRDAGGRAFFEHHGFRAVGEVENLRAPLDGNPLVTPARAAALAADVAAHGYLVRRALPSEQARLYDWVAAAFAPVWAHEVGRALAGPRGAVHVAVQRDAALQQNDAAAQQNYVAFAAADGNNQGLGWFGPAGTAQAHRGRGLGEALLIACLEDVRGLPEAGVIAWIGPKDFYRKTCGAVDDRRFAQLEEPPR